MRKALALSAVLVVTVLALPASAQQFDDSAFTSWLSQLSTPSSVLESPPSLVGGADGTYLGVLSNNPFDANSVSNPFGVYGSPFSPTSVNNPFSQYGSPYSAHSATNPYATEAPKIVNPYLGRLSANRYAPDSTGNAFGPQPKQGQGGSVVKGAAGTEASTGDKGLEHCDKPMGALAVVEPQSQIIAALARYRLSSPVGLIRLMIQQSNCFIVVERGAGMQNIMQERQLAAAGQARQNSNLGGGQM